MKKHKKITGALTALTCSVLGSTVNAENTHGPGDWDVSAALLIYQEPDRVSAVEPIISAKYHIDTDETLNFKLALDSLTGASANGAVPANQTQAFTRPSGKGGYQTPAGEVPLDDTFLDTRVAASVSWDKALNKGWKRNIGANISNEYDYLSLGANTLFSHDFNQKNSTLSFGASFQSDSIIPEGGTPEPLSLVQDGDKSGDESKTTFDLLLGITQVIDNKSFFQINYGASISDGYLTDPFKMITVVDANGDPVVYSIEGSAIQPEVIYENRPDSRTKHSLFGLYKRYIEGNVLETSYRFMSDDFGITSHTIDTRYRMQLSGNNFVQPHLRVYQQGAADFFTPFFTDGNVPTDLNSHASADYRLGDMTAYTLGFEYGRVNSENSWSVAAEYYLQSSKEPSNKFGSLNDLTLYPDVDAIMFRVVYDF